MEVLVSSALAVFFIALVTGAFIQIQESINKRKMSMSRDTSAILVRKNLSNISMIRASVKEPTNKTIYNCLCNTGTSCQNMTATQFILYDAPGTPTSSFFTSSGFACQANAADCIIEINYTIAAQCPPAPPFPSSKPFPSLTCNGPAEFVVIDYEIRKNPLIVDPKIQIKPQKGKIYTQISEISGSGSGVCP